MTTWEPELEELRKRTELGRRMGGEERIQRQHDAGRLTVRERIDKLLDPGTFHERGALAGRATYEGAELVDFMPANFVMGTGRIDGRPIVVGGDDFTVRGGASDASIAMKQIQAEVMAR
jgi:acetyl-CoA carboxylase carboxyltransferase component